MVVQFFELIIIMSIIADIVTSLEYDLTYFSISNEQISRNKIKHHARYLLENEFNDFTFNFHFLLFQTTFGTPGETFNLIYDTGLSHFLLHENITNNLLNKSSSTFHPTNETISIPTNKGIIKGNIVQDFVTLNSQKSHLPFHFVITKEIILGDGYAGFGRLYPGKKNYIDESVDIEVNLSPGFSFVNLLYESHIIPRKMFSHKVISKTKSKLYLGELPHEVMSKQFPKCKCGSRETGFTNEKVNDKWNCKLSGGYLKGIDKINFNASEYAIFDTSFHYIFAPTKYGGELLVKYKQLLPEEANCTVIEKFHSSVLLCSSNPFDYSNLPYLAFIFNSTEIIARTEDIIVPARDLGMEDGYVIGVIISDQIDFWVLGTSILMNYHFVFDSEDDTIGFAEDMRYVFEGSHIRLLYILFTIILFLLIIAGLFFLLNRPKAINDTREDSEKKINPLLA